MMVQAAKLGERYEIAFIDWQMPGLDGIETGRRIHALADGSKPPHLVMVTAYGREEVLKQAEESGFENVLIKPVTSSILFDTAVVALGGEGGEIEPAQSTPVIETDILRGARVLLVEDNEINQEVAIGQLEDANIFVDLAENGEQAIRMIEKNDYDVVLMDMQMPVMDGVAATRILRSDRRYQDLPIIAMTANALASDRELCLNVGMNDHIAKPIDPHQLFGVLMRWIRRDGGNEHADVPHVSPPLNAAESGSAPLAIQGIDTDAGLRLTGGNRARYEILLRMFVERQADTVGVIRLALSEGDTGAAERAAHSLKGVAATLGASALSAAAAEAEVLVRTGQDPEQALEALSLAARARNPTASRQHCRRRRKTTPSPRRRAIRARLSPRSPGSRSSWKQTTEKRPISSWTPSPSWLASSRPAKSRSCRRRWGILSSTPRLRICRASPRASPSISGADHDRL